MIVRILYVVSTLQSGGPTNQLFNLIKSLDRSFFLPIIVTLSSEPEDTRWTDFVRLEMDVQTLALSRLNGVFRAKSRLAQCVERLQPDLIHTHGIRADVLVAGMRLGIPQVATIHNFPQYDYRMTYGKLRGGVMLKLHLRAMKSIDKLIGCSESVADNLLNHFGLENVCGIANGVDQSSFYPVCSDNMKMLDILGLPSNAVIWVSTGSLSERKDPIFLINAWRDIEAAYPDQHLILLGSGPLIDQCKLLASELRNVHILGNVSNVVDYLHVARYYISASKSEGLPMASIEAMACGLPVLISDIAPHKELFKLSVDIGMVFQQGSLESFMTQFQAIRLCPYSQLRDAAIELVSQKLNAVNMSCAYQLLYKKQLGISQ